VARPARRRLAPPAAWLVLSWLLLVAMIGSPAAAGAGGLPPGLTAGGAALVKEVPAGDTVILQDGRLVRLAGIQAPKMSPSHGRGRKAPLADEARAALERLALGRTVSLWFGQARVDRHDRVLAQLVRDDGLWLQPTLLDQGWARVYALPDLHAVIVALLAAEAPARAAGRGIWGHRFYAVRSPDGLGRDIDTFQVVEGRVLTVALAKGQLFLNFGPDWRTDFTIHVPRRSLRAFRQAFGPPQQLQGRLVRVRGWVYRHNGPEIEVTVPEQLELLEPIEPPPPLPVIPSARKEERTGGYRSARRGNSASGQGRGQPRPRRPAHHAGRPRQSRSGRSTDSDGPGDGVRIHRGRDRS
jgi:endonuclease YncB( thermonuclease family)